MPKFDIDSLKSILGKIIKGTATEDEILKYNRTLDKMSGNDIYEHGLLYAKEGFSEVENMRQFLDSDLDYESALDYIKAQRIQNVKKNVSNKYTNKIKENLSGLSTEELVDIFKDNKEKLFSTTDEDKLAKYEKIFNDKDEYEKIYNSLADVEKENLIGQEPYKIHRNAILETENAEEVKQRIIEDMQNDREAAIRFMNKNKSQANEGSPRYEEYTRNKEYIENFNKEYNDTLDYFGYDRSDYRLREENEIVRDIKKERKAKKKQRKIDIKNSDPSFERSLSKMGIFATGFNIFNAVSTFKESKNEGNTTIGSLARAGVDFAIGEALGGWYMPATIAMELPKMAVQGYEGLAKLTREKNNLQRYEAFNYATFQDTQQLATMRQSGMEMAKMANYNLQQTLMGTEAKYLHR